METELIDRINAWLALPMTKDRAYLLELNAIFYILTGKPIECIGCNYTAMKKVLKQYLNNPQPIIKRSTIMTNTKYEFSTAAVKNGVTIVMNYKGATKLITPENLTDRDAEHILNNEGLNKAYGHNIQLKKGAQVETPEEPEGDDPEELTAARSEFETLTGNKPGNRKLSTLQTAIAEHKKAESKKAE